MKSAAQNCSAPHASHAAGPRLPVSEPPPDDVPLPVAPSVAAAPVPAGGDGVPLATGSLVSSEHPAKSVANSSIRGKRPSTAGTVMWGEAG